MQVGDLSNTSTPEHQGFLNLAYRQEGSGTVSHLLSSRVRSGWSLNSMALGMAHGVLAGAILLGAILPSTARAMDAVGVAGRATSPSAPVPALVRLPAPGLALRPQVGETATPTPTLTQEERLAQLEQQLDDAWNAQDWPEVLRLIDQIIAIDPNYDQIQDRKYHAHVSYGYQLMTERRCSEAFVQFQAALTLRPDGEEALLGLDYLSQYCATPEPATATPTPSTTLGPTLTPTPGTPTPTPAPTIVTEPFRYVVATGDTLYSIAKRYGTTIQAIMQANGMMDYFLRAGAEIWIPASEEDVPGPIVHIVQPGETLYSIARKYKTTVWAIMSMNGLRSYTVRAYRAIYVPSLLQPGPIIHIVQWGDTLYTIAQYYGTTVPLIMHANNLSTYAIHVFQRIVIPPVEWTGWPPIVYYTSPGPFLGPDRLYVVQKGDTLYSVSRRFGVTAAEIKALNGLTGSTIIAGATLRIP